MLPLNVGIGDRFTAMLTVDEVIHHAGLQWARTKQRHQCDHIFKAVGLQTLNQIFHAARFKLEHRGGFRALQHIEAFLIVQRDRGDIDRLQSLLFPARVDHLQRPVDDGQRTQTQEVELHQAGIFHIIFIELSHRELPMLIAIERRKIGDLRWRNDYAARMFTGVTRDPFQFARHIDQRFNLFVRVIHGRKLRFSNKGFFQRHAGIGRDQF